MAEDVAARDVLDDARALAKSGEWSKLVALVTSLHPADLAELVLLFDEDERVTLLDRLPTDVVGQLFEFAEDDELRNLIRGIGIQDLPAVLEDVDDDVAADVIQQLQPAEQVETLAALDRGVSVLCEVPAGVSVDECRELTQAVRRAESRTRATYMMAENYTYLRSNVLIREMVRRGLFGETHFAEAEYIHELKALNEITTWRRRWQTGINGNTYPTHSLGPVLQWMPGQRVNRVACAGSGRRLTDPRGDPYEQEASTLTLCASDKGGLIKLRLDMLSDRPHAMTNYQLQGIDGCYESSRAHGDRDRIWIRGRCAEGQWKDLSEFESEFLPDMWRSCLLYTSPSPRD